MMQCPTNGSTGKSPPIKVAFSTAILQSVAPTQMQWACSALVLITNKYNRMWFRQVRMHRIPKEPKNIFFFYKTTRFVFFINS